MPRIFLSFWPSFVGSMGSIKFAQLNVVFPLDQR